MLKSLRAQSIRYRNAVGILRAAKVQRRTIRTHLQCFFFSLAFLTPGGHASDPSAQFAAPDSRRSHYDNGGVIRLGVAVPSSHTRALLGKFISLTATSDVSAVVQSPIFVSFRFNDGTPERYADAMLR
jgi:hypothetical protein